jgi:ABC-2 type transport system permease protein
MAVYKRGYQRYQGPRTGYLARLMVVPRFAWQRLMEQRLIVILFVVSLFWPLACGLFIYLSNHLDLFPEIARGTRTFLVIDANFFVIFMKVQAAFAIILAAFAGPGLIAPDLANNALPLYFSRPHSRLDYFVSRMLVLAGILSLVTWVPGLLLFSMQSGMAGWDWFASNWNIGLCILAGFATWIVFVSLVALACSAWVKWRIVAGGLILGFFFVLAGAAELIRAILRVDWGQIISPLTAMSQVWRYMLGLDLLEGVEVTDCTFVIAAMTALLAVIVERRLRPVEVIK